MTFNLSSIARKLTKPTSFLGIKLWVVIIICLVLALVIVLVSTSVFIYYRLYRRNKRTSLNDVVELKDITSAYGNCSMERRLLSRNGWDMEMDMTNKPPAKQVMYTDDEGSSNGKLMYTDDDQGSSDGKASDDYSNHMATEVGPVCRCFTLGEIEAATKGLAYDNVIESSGDHGVAFRGVLMDGTRVVVKKLFSNRRSKEDFAREAESMLLLRHENLVKLLGYCAEGTYRILVYEYIENGNLDHWLHGSMSNIGPLPWDARREIIKGIAEGLAYLHEGTEPPFVHQNLKSSNVLLDKQWNPKLSDFGIRRFLGPEWTNASAPPAGMSGYIAPEYGRKRILDEKSDVYSFGILIMEIVSGKTSVESTFSEIEEYLVDWIKSMTADKKDDVIVDPRLPGLQLRDISESKKILLFALQCVHVEVEKRPKIRDIIHML